MPSYHYVALSQSGKELSGVIEAGDEASARVNLNQLGLSVVSIRQAEGAVMPQVAPKAGKTFEFDAIDRRGKRVSGTIVAEDLVKAFGRLFQEYQLNVTALVDSTATTEQKIAARIAGIAEIQKVYEKTTGKKNIKVEENMRMMEAVSRKELLDKVDITVKRVEEFLKTSGVDLKAEERETIQAYLNQLMRIKESTNLEHIRGTCERMLEHIEKQELFLHEEQKLKESSQIKIETQELLESLKRTAGLQKEIDIVKTATKWQEKPFLRPFAGIVLKLFGEADPAIRQVKEDIKNVNRHIFSYLRLIVTGKTKAIRHEAVTSIKTLWEERKRLKLKLHALKIAARQKSSINAPESLFWDNVGRVTGWALAFYLLVYLIAYPLTIKAFPLPRIPESFYFYQSQLTTFMTILLFFVYSAITLRNLWFRHHLISQFFLYPIIGFAFLLFAVNLL